MDNRSKAIGDTMMNCTGDEMRWVIMVTCLALSPLGCQKSTSPSGRLPPPVGIDHQRDGRRARSSRTTLAPREDCKREMARNQPFADPTQEQVDKWACRCSEGGARCCVILGELLDSPLPIMDIPSSYSMPTPRMQRAVRYYRRACRLGSGVGCLEAAILLGKNKGHDYRADFENVKRECQQGDSYACYYGAELADTGLMAGVNDKALARKLAERGCYLGGKEACEYIATHLSKDDCESDRYHQRACEVSPPNTRTAEDTCAGAALFSFQRRYQGVESRVVSKHRWYPVVSFDSLVIYCSIRYQDPDLCKKVLGFCRDREFDKKNKRKYCPLVEKAAERYQMARKRGDPWPPPLGNREYLLPSCKRARAGRKR